MDLIFLREKARQSGLRNWEQVKIIGGVRQSLWNKLRGKTDFSCKEIVRYCKGLGLTEEEFIRVMDYNGLATQEPPKGVGNDNL